MSITKKCKVSMCKNAMLARGVCRKHYWRLLNHGSIELTIKEKRKCSIENCVKVHYGHGYCDMHYKRYKKYGDANYTTRVHTNQTKHELYQVWSAIKSRCNDSGNKDYNKYGGRGITVCERWLGKHGFNNFRADMGNRPTKTNSIDRINNDGNYEPNNCRWGTKSQQSRNRGLSRKNKSGVTGVWKAKRAKRNKWVAAIYVNGKTKRLGYFDYKNDAVKARKEAELIYWSTS
jgi:hypothetical protein